MKKILLALFTVSAFILQAQSLEIISADTLVMGNAYNSFDMEGHVTVKNISATKNSYLAKRIDTGYTSLTDSNAICWGVCFTPQVSVSPIIIDINPGEVYNGFVGHVYPDQDGIPASGAITYVFYNTADSTDRVVFTMYYEVDQSFNLGEEADQKKLSVYPNPASGITEVKYNLNDIGDYTFELYNVLGTRIYGKIISGINGSFSFDASAYSKGVYFYVLRKSGDIVESKKLLIK